MGFSRRKLAFPELVARFRASRPGMSFDEAVRELSRRSAVKRRDAAVRLRRARKLKRWWED